MTKSMRRYVPEGPAPGPPWQPAEFDVAGGLGTIDRVRGWEYRGLGLFLISQLKARYRRKDGTRKLYQTWSATHLNTGHAVCTFRDLPFQTMLAAATDLAEMADWSFDGLEGWRNVEPEMGDKLAAWHSRHALGAQPGGGHRCQDSAVKIEMSRW